MCDQEDCIKAGEYVLIQRQGFMKLHKLRENGSINLGSYKVELHNIVGQKYFELFQMKPKGKKLYTLEKASEITGIDSVSIESSGKDNRDIHADCNSQALSTEEIERLRDENNSTEILGKLVANSKTFNSKTEYSQEKYLKKKQKKYFDYIRVLRPSIRLLADVFHKNDPYKTLGMRIDDLSQILSYSNVQSEGVHLLFDSGTAGLVPAAILNAIGANTDGKLIHLHPGNEWQRNAVIAMQFPKEQNDRLISVNIYSVLRWYYQKFNKANEVVETPTATTETPEDTADADENNKRKFADDANGNERKKPGWHFENQKACELLQEKVDSIIVVSKEHPLNITKELIPFLKPSRNIVVFNLFKEPLQELYFSLKQSTEFINVVLVNNFMRHYQVLPDRTHPLVNMNFGGYVLFGTKTKC